jgi:hypothetical protein
MGKVLATLLFAAGIPSLACGRADADTPDCNPPHFHFVNDGVTPVTMSVRAGTGCQFHFEMATSGFGMAGVLASNVTLWPKNGLLGHRSIRIYAYKPNDGFVGSDEFELKVRYNRDDGKGEHSSLLHVGVTVY